MLVITPSLPLQNLEKAALYFLIWSEDKLVLSIMCWVISVLGQSEEGWVVEGGGESETKLELVTAQTRRGI